MVNRRIDKPDLPSLGPLSILDDRERGILQFYGEFADYPPDQVVISQDAPQDSLFFVITGRLAVVRGEPNAWLVLAQVSMGEWFGEVNMLDPCEASATVIAETKTRLWSISREQLQEYLNDYPVEGCGLLVSIAGTLSRRARRLLTRLADLNLAENLLTADTAG